MWPSAKTPSKWFLLLSFRTARSSVSLSAARSADEAPSKWFLLLSFRLERSAIEKSQPDSCKTRRIRGQESKSEQVNFLTEKDFAKQKIFRVSNLLREKNHASSLRDTICRTPAACCRTRRQRGQESKSEQVNFLTEKDFAKQKIFREHAEVPKWLKGLPC